MPFDAGEIDSPRVVGLGGRGMRAALPKAAQGMAISSVQPLSVSVWLLIVPWTWTAVRRPGISQPLSADPAVFIGLGEEEVPGGVEGVHFELEVFVGVGVGIDEEFEVVVVEDDGVVLGEGAPDVGFFEFGGDVEVLVVPLHFGAGLEAGLGFLRAFDVEEEGRPGGLLPLGVEVAIDGDWLGGAGGDVAVGLGGEGEGESVEKIAHWLRYAIV